MAFCEWKVDAWEVCVWDGGGYDWCMLDYIYYEMEVWGGIWTLRFSLGLEGCGGMVTWVMNMMDGVEDDGMVCEIIGVVKGEIEVALLLLGSKFG